MDGNRLITQPAKVISKKPTGVFYVDRNKAYYFELTISTPIALDIPTDILANFELMNKKKLHTLLTNFIRTYKLEPKNIVILLSTQVTFDKEFPHGSIEVQKNIQEFLELVPFEEMLDKRIIANRQTKVVATNKEVCDAIKQSFTAHGFLVSGVYPLSQVIESIPQLKQNLDLSLFVNKVTDLKALNLQPIVEAAMHSSPAATFEKEKSNKTRLFLLIGVFGFLTLILGYVIYTNIISPSQDELPNTLPPPTLAPVVPITNTQPQVESEITVEEDASLSAEVSDENPAEVSN